MNPAQRSTWAEAAIIASELRRVGGGVTEIAALNGDREFLHFRFLNSEKQLNVGLIREMRDTYPNWREMVAAQIDYKENAVDTHEGN